MPKPRSKPRRSAPSDEAVYQRIFDAIGTQNLAPETRLREEEIGSIFGVSRAVVRKVFARLAVEGLLRIEPNRGASVAKPTPEEARANFAARQAIEVAIIRAAAASFSAADKKRLSEHLAAEEGAERAGDGSEMIRLSGEFHILIAEVAGNPILQKFLRELITRESLIILAYERPGRPSCSNHEHRLILNALARRDAEDAGRLMLQHLGNVEERLDLARETRKPLELKQIFKRA